MPRYTYDDTSPLTYSMYLDASHPDKPPKTLEAVPGETYDIRPGEGYTVLNEAGERVPLELPMPPDDRWGPAQTPIAAKAVASKKENG